METVARLLANRQATLCVGLIIDVAGLTFLFNFDYIFLNSKGAVCGFALAKCTRLCANETAKRRFASVLSSDVAG